MTKLPGPINVPLINETFFTGYEPHVINWGECFVWAYAAFRIYKNIELWDFSAHAFVRDKATGRFYDSEFPQGTFHWWQLPATKLGYGCGCIECKVPPAKITIPRHFRVAWEPMRHKYHWDWWELHRQIERVIGENT